MVLRAGEHQVLEQVREAGATGRLIGRADVVPDTDRHHRRLVVLVHHHRQPVGQGEAGVGDVRDACLGGGVLGQRLGRGEGGRRGEPGACGQGAGDQQGKRSDHGVLLGRVEHSRLDVRGPDG